MAYCETGQSPESAKNVTIYKRQVPFSVVGISTQKIVLSLFLSTRKEANLPAPGLLPVLHLVM